MDTWPFSLISPEDFASLTKREKALLECLTATFLAFASANHADKAQPVDLMH
ncbi:hypothetical protein D3C71_2132490 [compost metagenome]